ncbi:GntR family transcriptional regulator [Dactylosporangium sucinum]|uniref:GntR family transcriptional regulator n=1 Tax=Dactylosporangium sucinum TaxID=1424081 RepID=UPI00167D024D|nr:GntR family transcriptional regulator [Dactylosporangium sucinum]
MSPINRRSDRPVYKQVADDLRRRINEGEFAAGAALPSEPTLSEQYDGVSRTIVRQGLGILKNEGLIHSHHGKGWFVRAQRPVRRMASSRYQAELDQVGRAESERDATPFYYDHKGFEQFELQRTLTEVPADDELAEVFRVPVGTMLLCREFTFVFDGTPHRRSYSYLLLDMVQGTPITDPANEPWPGGTMAQLDSVGVRVTAVDEIVRSRMPNPDEIAALDIDDGVPVVAVRRIMYAGEKPVEACVDIVIPADRVVLYYRTELLDPRRGQR